MKAIELVWTADVDRVEGGFWLAKTETIVGPYSTSEEAEKVLAEVLARLPNRVHIDSSNGG